MKTCSQQKKILIIKFGGLGDVVLSLDAMFSIIKHHKALVTLLTEKPFDSFFERSKWFSEIVTIRRSLLYFKDILQITKEIDCSKFDFVYDLQTSSRTSFYLKLFNKEKAITNGIGKHAKICHSNRDRNNMHTSVRQSDQISLNNIKLVSSNEYKWIYNSDYSVPKKKYVMIVPGGSEKRKNKRIPYKIYSELIKILQNNDYQVLLIGSNDDEKICGKLKTDFPEAQNLCKKTNLFELGKLSKFSSLTIGNDTGPMHLISKGGGETFVFFTKHSNPQLCRPIGSKVSVFTYTGDVKKFFEEIFSKLKINLCLDSSLT